MKANLLIKQLFISIIIGFLPYCFLTIYFTTAISQASVKERALTTRFHLESVAQAIEGTIINFEEMSQFIIGNETIRAYLTTPENAPLAVYNEAYNAAIRELYLLPFGAKSYAGVSVFRNDGARLNSGAIRSMALTEEERATAKALSGGWFWSTEGGHLAMCRLIRDKGTLVNHNGYVKLIIDPAKMKNILSVGSEMDEFFAVMTADGELLFTTFPDEVQWLFSSGELKRQAEVNTGEFTLARDGREYALRLLPIENRQTVVASLRMPEREPYMLYRNTFLLLGVVLAVIIVTLQIGFTNRWFIKPLFKLAKLMKSIEVENYKERFNVRGNDEIAVVARQFNKMSDRLQSLYEQVYQSRLKAQEAEILALQAEINPHFMLNTLDNIYWMVNMAKGDKAMQMIRARSESFRITLYKTKDGFVTLKMAVEQVQHYLYIQKARMQEQLQYSIEIEEGIDPEQTMVLHLVLQPLVENAVRHGIEADGGGEVIVLISLQENTLQCSIYDTGSCADPDKIARALENPPEGSHGLALYNINSRIKIMFGNEYGVLFLKPEDRGSMFIVSQPLVIRKG